MPPAKQQECRQVGDIGLMGAKSLIPHSSY